MLLQRPGARAHCCCWPPRGTWCRRWQSTPADQPAASRGLDQFRSCRRHRLAVDPPEFGDRLMVRIQSSQQPHQFHVATALGLQSPRGTDRVLIPEQIQIKSLGLKRGRSAPLPSAPKPNVLRFGLSANDSISMGTHDPNGMQYRSIRQQTMFPLNDLCKI